MASLRAGPPKKQRLVNHVLGQGNQGKKMATGSLAKQTVNERVSSLENRVYQLEQLIKKLQSEERGKSAQ